MKQFIHQFVEPPKLIQTTDPTTGKRAYQTPGGNYYPSVTTFLSELPSKHLDAWKKRVGKQKADIISKAATTRGSSLHSVLEQYLKNSEIKFSTALQQKLFQQVKPTVNGIDNIKLIEEPLYSDRLRLAGTPDCVAEYASELSVIDFKTSTRIKKEDWIVGYYCQTAAYAIMYEELYGVRPTKAVIIVAIEEANVPQVFTKDISECFFMLREYASKLLVHRNGG